MYSTIKELSPNLPFWELSASSSPTQPPLFKQTKEEREISEKVIFLQQGSSSFLESQVKNKHKRIFQKGIALQTAVLLKCLQLVFFLKFTLLKTKVGIYHFCFASGEGRRNFLTLVVTSQSSFLYGFCSQVVMSVCGLF